MHDLSWPASRSSLRRVWLPETMKYLANTRSMIDSRRVMQHYHVTSAGAIIDLKQLLRQWLLTRQMGFLSGLQEFSSLLVLLVRLLLNESGLWTDEVLDKQLQFAFLQSCSVPVAIVGTTFGLLFPENAAEEGLPRGVVSTQVKLGAPTSSNRMNEFFRQVQAKKSGQFSRSRSHGSFPV